MSKVGAPWSSNERIRGLRASQGLSQGCLQRSCTSKLWLQRACAIWSEKNTVAAHLLSSAHLCFFLIGMKCCKEALFWTHSKTCCCVKTSPDSHPASAPFFPPLQSFDYACRSLEANDFGLGNSDSKTMITLLLKYWPSWTLLLSTLIILPLQFDKWQLQLTCSDLLMGFGCAPSQFTFTFSLDREAALSSSSITWRNFRLWNLVRTGRWPLQICGHTDLPLEMCKNWQFWFMYFVCDISVGILHALLERRLGSSYHLCCTELRQVESLTSCGFTMKYSTC